MEIKSIEQKSLHVVWGEVVLSWQIYQLPFSYLDIYLIIPSSQWVISLKSARLCKERPVYRNTHKNTSTDSNYCTVTGSIPLPRLTDIAEKAFFANMKQGFHYHYLEIACKNANKANSFYSDIAYIILIWIFIHNC